MAKLGLYLAKTGVGLVFIGALPILVGLFHSVFAGPGFHPPVYMELGLAVGCAGVFTGAVGMMVTAVGLSGGIDGSLRPHSSP
jgi:hypothetical protein